MTRTEIFTDGSYVDQSRSGGWAAVIVRHVSGQKANTSSQEMELRALVEAVRMADGPCTVVSDQEGIVHIAQEGKRPEWGKALWDQLYAAMQGKDVVFEWKRRSSSLGSRLAHQLAREAAKGLAA